MFQFLIKLFKPDPVMEWNRYLAKLPKEDGELIRYLWDELLATGMYIPLPHTWKAEDGTCWQFAWDIGEHHLDIDVYANKHLYWFYRNRKTEALDSGDIEPGKPLSFLRAYLALIDIEAKGVK